MEKETLIDGMKLHYNEEGEENTNTILLLHGWGCNHTTLKSIENIVKDKMHVFNFDLPGFGKSDEPKNIWGVDEYTQLIEKFVKENNIESPILLGHSFGGRISILFSSRNKTRKVILTDAAGIKPKRSLRYYYKVYTYKTLKKLLPMVVGKKYANKLIEKYRGKSGSSDYNQASPMMRTILSKCVNEDLKSVMPHIKAPTLLIWGENDTATPIYDAQIMERLIPDAGLVSFPNCGHYCFLDNPIGYKAVIKEFLKEELK